MRRRLVAETLGTAFLLAAIVGSGIMGERLAGGNVGLALLANSLATGTGLAAILLAVGPVSGGHLNPAVSLAAAATGGLAWGEAAGYVAAQLLGALAGVAVAHAMFAEPLLAFSQHARHGSGQLLSEFVATFGLLGVIEGCARSRRTVVPFAVALYIVAAYWFTASTSFANPAVTLARALTDTFAGIRPTDVPGFVIAQLLGAGAATALFGWLVPSATKTIVFACVHNAGRSQMAAAFFNQLADPARARAVSAGTHPGVHVHPEVVQTMREVGIDLARARPRRLTEGLAAGADMLVTMGCGEACPVIPGLRREDWPIEDPKGQAPARVREIRDEVRARVEAFVASEGFGQG